MKEDYAKHFWVGGAISFALLPFIGAWTLFGCWYNSGSKGALFGIYG